MPERVPTSAAQYSFADGGCERQQPAYLDRDRRSGESRPDRRGVYPEDRLAGVAQDVDKVLTGPRRKNDVALALKGGHHDPSAYLNAWRRRLLS